MISQKSIVVIVGNDGSVVTFFDGSTIANKVFLEELNDTTKAELNKVLSKYKSSPVYLLVDTVDQSYKKKFYPNIRKTDVAKLVKRELANDGDRTSLKNFLIFDKKNYFNVKERSTKRWEALFVSTANGDLLNNWADFLTELPNRFMGIYMLPIETFNFFKKLKPKPLKTDKKNKEKKKEPKPEVLKEEVCCVVVQNKVSGFRQIVFSNDGIIFTRIVTYNTAGSDFSEKYEQDIYSTFEYLRRLLPNILIADLKIINIFSEEALEKIKASSNSELAITNYTPFEAAVKAGFPKLLSKTAPTADLLLAKAFVKEKKILKFSNNKVASLDKLYLLISSARYLNVFLTIIIIVNILLVMTSLIKFNILLQDKEDIKFAALKELDKLQRATVQGLEVVEKEKEVDIEKAADFGRIDEFLGSKNPVFAKFYSELKILKDFNIRLGSISYTLPDFPTGSPPLKINHQLKFSGNIINKSGDIESLFSEFDSFSVAMKNKYSKEQIRFSEIPRNIDFNQKYYSFPIDFTIVQNK
jgi:hypothetical protein